MLNQRIPKLSNYYINILIISFFLVGLDKISSSVFEINKYIINLKFIHFLYKMESFNYKNYFNSYIYKYY